jgi:hypothetical protein
MSCYTKVLQTANLNSDSQGTGNEFGALWTLMSALDHYDNGGDVLPNPASEVLRRLDPWKENKFMRESVTPFLTGLADKFARA